VTIARLLPALFLTGVLLLIIAAARPQTFLSHEQRSVNALAIEMLVDVSGSMDALDLSERTAAGIIEKTRLAAVKETFNHFVEQRPDDLIGLVSFGGYASTRCPLTADHEALLHVLKGVEIPHGGMDNEGRPVDMEEDMTAIGDGLATALARLEHAEPKTHIVVLLTDGANNTGVIAPEQALDAAVKMHIRVYAIGVGSNGPVPIRVRDNYGRQAIVTGNFPLDEGLLKHIADASGGRYFNVRDPDGLRNALDVISKLETTQIDRTIYQQYKECFVLFLLAGALMTALAITLHMQLTRRLL